MLQDKLKIVSELVKKFIYSGIFKSSVYVSLSKIFSSACNFIFMIYAVNLLNKTENGQFQYYLGFLPLILAIAEFGLPNAIIKYLSPQIENKDYIGKILFSSLLIKFIAFLFLVLFGVTIAFVLKEDPIIVSLLVIGGVAFSFVSYYESILVSFRAYKVLALWNPIANLGRLLVLYFVHRYTDYFLSYIDILAIFTLSPIFTLALFHFVFDHNKLYWNTDTQSAKSGIKELTLFNLWAFAASLCAIASDRLEIFFLKKYHSPETVAVYGTALQLFSGFVIILSTYNSMLMPGLSRMVEKEDFKNYLLKSLLVSVGIIVLLSPGYFLGDPIFTILYNNKYADSVPVYKILYPNYLLQLLFAPLGIALFAMGKPKILTILAFLRLFFGFILDNVLIPEFGVVGAGLSFLLGQLISWLVLAGYIWAIFWR